MTSSVKQHLNKYPNSHMSATFSTFWPKAGYGKFWVDEFCFIRFSLVDSPIFKILFKYSVHPWAWRKENSKRPVEPFRNQALGKIYNVMSYNSNIGGVYCCYIYRAHTMHSGLFTQESFNELYCHTYDIVLDLCKFIFLESHMWPYTYVYVYIYPYMYIGLKLWGS